MNFLRSIGFFPWCSSILEISTLKVEQCLIPRKVFTVECTYAPPHCFSFCLLCYYNFLNWCIDWYHSCSFDVKHNGKTAEYYSHCSSLLKKNPITNWASTGNNLDSLLPWITPNRATDKAGLKRSSSKRKWKTVFLS